MTDQHDLFFDRAAARASAVDPRRTPVLAHLRRRADRPGDPAVTLEDRRALADASGRLLASLDRLGARHTLEDRVRVVAHRLEAPGVRTGHDPVGLVYALTEAVAVLAEAAAGPEEVTSTLPAGAFLDVDVRPARSA